MVFIFSTVYERKDMICRPKWPETRSMRSHYSHFEFPCDGILHLNLPTPQKEEEARVQTSGVTHTPVCIPSVLTGGLKHWYASHSPDESVFFSRQLAITSIYSVSRNQADRHWQSIINTTKEPQLLSSPKEVRFSELQLFKRSLSSQSYDLLHHQP